MKEFIEKLINKLEESDINDIQMIVREVLLKYGFPYESCVQDEVWNALDELSTNKFAIKIVKQFAEEYKQTIDVSELVEKYGEKFTNKATVRGGEITIDRIYAVTMSNGDIYGVPAEVIADDYAKYYEEKYGEDYQDNFNEVIGWFDSKDFEFADWAKNSMDWDDVKDKAKLLERVPGKIDFQDGWVNGQYRYMKLEVEE